MQRQKKHRLEEEQSTLRRNIENHKKMLNDLAKEAGAMEKAMAAREISPGECQSLIVHQDEHGNLHPHIEFQLRKATAQLPGNSARSSNCSRSSRLSRDR